jgi:hypothetical protein
VNILQFSFSLSYTGPRILLYTFLSKIFICFLSLSRHIWEDDIKMDHTKMALESMDWIGLAQDGDKLWALFFSNMAMNFQVP